jgi:hypothetical protein
MVTYIDQHRATHGVEPICDVLPIAPSTYFRRKAEQRDPTRRSGRALRDEVLRAIFRRSTPEWFTGVELDSVRQSAQDAVLQPAMARG